MPAHSSILAWEIPWTEEPAGYSQSVVSQKSWTQLSNKTKTKVPLQLTVAVQALYCPILEFFKASRHIFFII